jgi:hypothetical protein
MSGEQCEEERDYVQIAHYRLMDAMDERRREIGADPGLAQSFQKVWERVERRTNRLHKLDASGMTSSGSFLADSYGSGDYLRTRPAGTSTTTGSSLIMSTSTEITDDDDTGADTDDDSFAITDDSCLSEKSSSTTSSASKKGSGKANGGLSPTRRSSAAGGLPLASPRGRSKSMGDASAGGSGGSSSGAASSSSRSAISRGDADLGVMGGPKLVFKCWRNNKRKIFTVPAKGITYVKFVLFLYKKLDIESHQPLRLCHRTVKSSGGETKQAITDEASFKAFLADHGTAKDATTTYSLWVE